MLLHVIGDGLVGFKAVGGDDGDRLCPTWPRLSRQRPTAVERTPSSCALASVTRTARSSRPPTSAERSNRASFSTGDAHANLYGGLVGGEACRKEPRTCDLSRGIVTDDVSRTITFRLVCPDADFLYKLALPFAYPVPPSVPSEEQVSAGIPGTGPYMLEAPVTERGTHAGPQPELPRLVVRGAARRERGSDRVSRSGSIRSTGRCGGRRRCRRCVRCGVHRPARSAPGAISGDSSISRPIGRDDLHRSQQRRWHPSTMSGCDGP